MNIKKTNPIGVAFIESQFKLLRNTRDDIINNSNARALVNNIDVKDFVNKNKGTSARMGVFDYQKDAKTLRVSKNIIDVCKLIDIESIKENIDVSELDFSSLIILLDNDSSGMIKIERVGSDFDFLYLKDLTNMTNVYFDSYSFLTKEFNFFDNIDDSLFVVKLIAYLYYGEISTIFIPAKSKKNINVFKQILNNSSVNISFVDSLWKQRISTDGFNVRGHFRLQPIGVERKKRKLIWIEEFKKDGYNRRATIELV